MNALFNSNTNGKVLASVLGLVLASHVVLMPLASFAQAPYWDPNTGGTAQTGTDPNAYYGTQPQPNPYAQPQQPYTQPYGQQYTQPYGQPQQYGQQYNQQYGQPQLYGYVSSAPAGTSFSTAMATYISSQSASVGDPVSVNLSSDLSVGSGVVLPAGTNVQGEVASVRSANYTGSHGQIQLRFNRAQLPDGRVIPLSARVVTPDGTGMIKGGTTGQRLGKAAVRTVGGAAVGAGLGAILGAIRGRGRADDYALRGAAIGGTGGLISTAASRGQEAELQPGMPIQLVLTQPLTVSGAGQGMQQPYQQYP